MSSISLYLLMLLNSLEGMAVVCSLIFGVIAFVSFVFMKAIDPECNEDEFKRARSVFKPCFVVALIAILWVTFIPNTKQALTIMGVSYVTQNERVEKNVDKALDLFETVVDKKLKEVKESH